MRIYEYRARRPTTNLNRVEEQMYLAHKYQHTLVELERARREAVRWVTSEDAEVAALEERVRLAVEVLDTLREEIAKGRQKARKNTTPRAVREKARSQRKHIKALRGELRQERTRARAEAKDKLDAINERATVWGKAARKASGLYWGTYLIVEQAMDAARKEKTDPKFRRWDGGGRVAVQVQRGLRTEGVVGGADARVQIDPSQDTRTGRRRGTKTTMRLRVGSEGRAPIFTEIPITLHRPLPPGRIKWAALIREKVANATQWKVQFTVDEDAPKRGPGVGTVAIDVGWRLLRDGSLRVAYSVDEHGQEDKLRLPARLLSKIRHHEDLRSLRDRLLDEKKARVAEWLSTGNGPEEVKAAHVRMWRNPARVVQLLRAHGEAMPRELRADLEAWARKDRHLWQWEVHEARKARRKRREQYRLYAHALAQRYSVVVLEDFDLRDVAQRGEVEDGPTTDRRRPNYLRTIAAISELRQCLVSAGLRVVAVPAEYTTQRCHSCGHVGDFDAAKAIDHTCSSCGRTWDQDANAARNILASAPATSTNEKGAREQQSSDKPPLSARQRRFRGIADNDGAKRSQEVSPMV